MHFIVQSNVNNKTKAMVE